MMRHNEAAQSGTLLILHCMRAEGNFSERSVGLLGQDSYSEPPNNYFWPVHQLFTSSPVTDDISIKGQGRRKNN